VVEPFLPAVSLGNGETPGTVTIYLSLAARHPEGKDAAYIEWHAVDHEPEQHRLSTVWASRRVVSTPECRAVRAASFGRYDEVDHVMAYFFVPPPDFKAFEDLNNALGTSGRTKPRLPILERGTWQVHGKVVAPGGIVSPDVLPWRPIKGIYLILERGSVPAADLAEISGVTGVWWAGGALMNPVFATSDNTGMQLTLCYVDGDVVETATRLKEPLQKRWDGSGLTPVLAAPFQAVVANDWARYLP
jgi:hypothetical protein